MHVNGFFSFSCWKFPTLIYPNNCLKCVLLIVFCSFCYMNKNRKTQLKLFIDFLFDEEKKSDHVHKMFAYTKVRLLVISFIMNMFYFKSVNRF